MWYTVSLLFKGVHVVEPQMAAFWEEAIVLVDADDDRQARASADSIGKSKEHEYYVEVPTKHLLKWVFMQTDQVYAIEESVLGSGTEIFSRFLRQSEVESLLTPFDEAPDPLRAHD